MPTPPERVKETSTTTGTGTLNLDGAVAKFRSFVAGVGTGNQCYYSIVHQSFAEWEVGIGTVTDATPDTLSRTTVLASSNAGALVNFSAGTKDVFVTIPGSKIALLNDANAFTANQTISNTAPSLILTDTTASAKSLTIAVDANIADLRESAGASGSLLTLDLANARVGIGTTSPGQKLDVIGTIKGDLLSVTNANPIYLPTIQGGTGTTLQVLSNGYVNKVSSSARYKNIEPGGWSVTADQLQQFIELTPRVWDYKGGQQGAASFISEDLDALGISNKYGRSILVNYDNEGRPESNRDFSLIALQHLILQQHNDAIQELSAKVDSLAASAPIGEYIRWCDGQGGSSHPHVRSE